MNIKTLLLMLLMVMSLSTAVFDAYVTELEEALNRRP